MNRIVGQRRDRLCDGILRSRTSCWLAICDALRLGARKSDVTLDKVF